MFDLEIALPVCIKQPQYKNRYDEFKKFGLANIKHKVHVTVIHGAHEKPDLTGWSSDLSVSAVEWPHDHPASKIADYYSNLLQNSPVKARWYMKLDDDSFTDVATLIECLDAEHDYNEPFYIVNGMNNNLDWVEFDVLRKYDMMRYVSNPKAKLWHEWEACVLSHGFVEKMRTQEMIGLWRFRSTFHQGSSDQTLGIVSKMLKVPPIEAYFMSKEAIVYHLSIFGGTLAHIHDLAPDRNAHLWDMVKKQLDPGSHRDKWLSENGSTFDFYAVNEIEEKKITTLRLLPNGRIEGQTHDNESMWTDYFAPRIEFFSGESVKTSTFNPAGDGTWRGPYAFDEKITHLLKRVQ